MRALALAMGRFSGGGAVRAVPLWIVAACGVVAGAVTARALGASAALAEAPAQLTAAPASASGDSVESIVMILAVMMGGIFALAQLRKKRATQPPSDGPELRLIGHVRVAGRWQVALVRVPGRTLVLGSSDKGLTLLATLADEVHTADTAQACADHATGSALAAPAQAAAEEAAEEAQEPFDRFLDRLTRRTPARTANAPSASRREHPDTLPADTLRARLARYQQDAHWAG
jgi:flagellar biogenesis protein FliO